MKAISPITTAALAVSLVACAGSETRAPEPPPAQHATAQPAVAAPPLARQSVVMKQPSRVTGQRVDRGGTVVGAASNGGRTEIEVLAYPLDERGRPDTRRSPLGRFLAVRSGPKAPADVGPGTLVTVSGVLLSASPGQEAPRLPTIVTDSVRVWEPDAPARSSSNVKPTFDVGGSGGSATGPHGKVGMGVGIGF
ncbi:MAG: Slp family lipoprotein [Gammaproteobacteria bacterium]|jgi:outer membrane lipoprotein|nr:Slp family lipoprotein [Gammaproteobacteria bacterium]